MIPKFRAWDKDSQRMVNDVYIAWEEFKYADSLNEILEHENFIFTQSTGLFDKNGKEIFEGDIVSYIDGEYSYVGFIDKSIFGYFVSNGKIALDDFENVADESSMTADLTILGNIYENSDLLEDK